MRREAGGAWIIWAATQTKKSPAFERFLAICQSGQDKDYASFTLSPNENPAIDAREREKMATILSKDEYEIRMLGHGSAAGAMALYPQWDDDRNLAPLDQDYVPANDDNWWLFFDPGAHYAGMVLACVNKLHPRRLSVIQCWQPQRATLRACVTMVRDRLGGRKLEGLVYDQAARKGDMVGRSIANELNVLVNTKGTDIFIHRGMMMGRSEYMATVPLMRRYLHCDPGDPDYPTNLILNRSPESGCALLRWQIQNCAFTDKAYELKEENIQKGNDHLSDACRYGISRMPAWVDRGANPQLWGEGSNGFDPDADRTAFDDTTHPDLPTPAVSEASRLSRLRAERRGKVLAKQRRSGW